MKRKFYIFAGLLLIGFSSFAKTIKVGKQKQFHSISQAITAAVNGDTILVDNGIYKEKNIIINKSITLLGNNYPVLDGEHQYEIISIKANHVTVKGFKFVHSGVSSLIDFAAIKIYNCRDVTISGNVLEDTFFGIYSQSGINCLIENNTITGIAKTEQASGNG
ncbi:MAG: right-handed parallel beta-helix repeat-containing protein, partial [Ginsengibacter sp.]